MNSTLNINLFILTLRCVKLMKKLISFFVNCYICLKAHQSNKCQQLVKYLWRSLKDSLLSGYSFSYRSSHQRCSLRKGVLRNFAKFTGKQLCQSLFFHKVEGLRPAQVLSCEFCEISENTFFTEHPWATASVVKLSAS